MAVGVSLQGISYGADTVTPGAYLANGSYELREALPGMLSKPHLWLGWVGLVAALSARLMASAEGKLPQERTMRDCREVIEALEVNWSNVNAPMPLYPRIVTPCI
jgi:hypothetical protein